MSCFCVHVLRVLSPGWIKTCLYSVISSYGYFFYMPRFIYLCRTSFILVFSQRTVTANACEWTTLCAFKLLSFKKILGTLEGQQAYSTRKDYFDHFSVAQVIIVRGLSFSFFSFNYIVLLSFCRQISFHQFHFIISCFCCSSNNSQRFFL